MSVPVVKFNKQDRPDFYRVLRERVNQYFEDNHISRHANFNMKFKTVFMIFLYTTPLVLMLTGVVNSLWPVMAMWAIMGVGMSGIGLSIMHDANHGAYSSNPKVNQALGYILNFLGGYHVNWKIQHNVLHHSFTNVHGYDEDIGNTAFRFSPDVPQRPMYRYQVFYAPFLYGLMGIDWLLTKDFIRLGRYEKMDLLKDQGLTYGKAMAQIIFNKTWYVALTLALPMLVVDLPWWQTLLGFLLMQFICGLILAFIFQSAHVLEATEFYHTDESGCVENSWAIHQLRTTANFANNSTLFSWFIGGLNYQIEHHLFPNVCHVHYPKLSKIVKATAAEYNLPYYQYKTFLGALKSHFVVLNQLGTGTYDRKLAGTVSLN